mgnify:CR=1 FL=1
MAKVRGGKTKQMAKVGGGKTKQMAKNNKYFDILVFVFVFVVFLQ